MNAMQTALDAYLTRTAAIHAKLERLQQLADDHFGHDPDALSLIWLKNNLLPPDWDEQHALFDEFDA